MEASKLQEQLLNNPEWVARRKEQDEHIRRKRLAILAEQKPVLDELRHVGILSDSLDDVLANKHPYPQAIPVLFKHLNFEYSDAVRASIIRCIAVKEAIPYWEFIVDTYKKQSPQHNSHISLAKQALAAAIDATFTPSRLDELILLISDKSLGPTRVMLLRHLRRRFRNPRIKAVLQLFLSDPELEKEIRAWKKKF